jgi:hypothetical protein
VRPKPAGCGAREPALFAFYASGAGPLLRTVPRQQLTSC